MKKLLMAIVMCLPTFLFAQPDSSVLKQISIFRAGQQYDNIIKLLKNEKSDLWNNYQLACYYSLSKDSSQAFCYLHRAIKLGANGENILTDSDFKNLHKYTRWVNIVDTLEKIYVGKYPSISNNNLAIELWHMYIDDQQYRTLGKNNKISFEKMTYEEHEAINKAQTKREEENRVKLSKIIKQYGWPTYNMVGKEAADAAFLILQHSEKKYIKKYLSYLQKAALSGEASKPNYAMMYDRMLMYDGKKQYYGTQIIGAMDSNGVPIPNKWQFYPIEDYENVNQRRTDMGLCVIEEYAKKMKVEYNPNLEVKNLKFR